MESSLTSFQDESTRTSTIAVETSRCARCVRDRKGCDRLLPCSRCVDAGMDDSCMYTGAIHNLKRRHSRRGHGTDASPMVAPQDKRRRRGRNANGLSKGQAPSRASHEDATKGEDDWFRDAPETAVDVAEIEPEKTDLEFVRSRIYNIYSDIVTHLPVELYRSTTFIRALDASYHLKSEALDSLCRTLQHLESAEQVSTTRSKIHQLMIESDEDRAEAIVEVAKLQTLVASHIAVLTTDLDAAGSRSSSMPITMETSSKSILGPSKKARTGHRKPKPTGTDDGLDIPIDEDEPIYCYCQRVSFGKMIACENEHCEGGEWFHFQCLGWTVAPRGKWWCQVCADAGMGSKKFVRRREELQRTKPSLGKSPVVAGRLADSRNLKRERSLSRLNEKSHKIQSRKQR